MRVLSLIVILSITAVTCMGDVGAYAQSSHEAYAQKKVDWPPNFDPKDWGPCFAALATAAAVSHDLRLVTLTLSPAYWGRTPPVAWF